MTHKFSTDAFPSETQLRDMMEKLLLRQSELNTAAYDQAWVEKAKTGEFDYPLAAGFEIFEMGVSWNQWNWWSKSTPNDHDMLNMRIEIVDALHFILSDVLVCYDLNVVDAANDAAVNLEGVQKTLNPLQMQSKTVITHLIKDLLNYAGSIGGRNKEQAIRALSNLYRLSIHACGMGFRGLASMYFAKSVLNAFRQKHGYREKKYTKIWAVDGKTQLEDNHILMAWVAEQTSPSREQIEVFLESSYAEVLRAKKGA